MKRHNLILSLASLSVVLTIGLGCNALSRFTANSNASANANSASTSSSSNSAATSNTSSKSSSTSTNVEKADFTVTSDQLDQEFTRKGVKDSDLEKYSNKTIAVSGRVHLLVKEKKGTTQPWVTLAAPGLGHGVSCYFDDDDVSQMDMLEEDAMVKVQGYQDSFIVPEVSPMLKHCVVLEGAK